MMTTRQDDGSVHIWTPANIVTLVRICLVPLFVIVLISPWPHWFGFTDFSNETKSLIAAGIFIIISCTDWVDGYLARSRNEVTDFGKFMDPLADKILVCAALLALVELQVLPSWPVLIILIREFIVAGIRMMAASRGVVIAASWYGKAKTVFQIIAIGFFLIKDSLTLPNVGAVLQSPLYLLSWVVMIIALALTILSMLDYLAKARRLLGFSIGSAQESAVPDADILAHEASDLAASVISHALEAHLTLGTAESLTGGLISATLTEIPGSSTVVRGGIVSYVNEVKETRLLVPHTVLATDGAVSAPCAQVMAQGALDQLGANITVSVTGIAGPTGAEAGKPVGTVFLGLADNNDTVVSEYHFSGNRDQVRWQTVIAALKHFNQALGAYGA